MSFLISFCNAGCWCSRYALGVAGDDFRQFSWLKADTFLSSATDHGATGIHVFSDGVLVGIQSRQPRVAWLDADLRLRKTFALRQVRDPHSITSQGHEALIVCSRRNRLYSLDLKTGAERCVFVAHKSDLDVVHLNGVTFRGGHLLVSMFGPERAKGKRRGCILDTETKQVFVDNLVEPHSPTEYDGDLYVLSSAAGELFHCGSNGTQVRSLGGYLRGLAITLDCILVGRSAWRAGHRQLGGLRKPPMPMTDPHANAWQRSAVIRLDRAGKVLDTIDFSFFGPEIYDIAKLHTTPAAARLFDHAAYRRLDALQEAHSRLSYRRFGTSGRARTQRN